MVSGFRVQGATQLLSSVSGSNTKQKHPATGSLDRVEDET